MDGRIRRRGTEARVPSIDGDHGMTKRSSRCNTLGNTIATLAAAAAAAPEAEAPAPTFSARGVSRSSEPFAPRERSRTNAFAVDTTVSGIDKVGSSRQGIGRHQDSRPRLSPAPIALAPSHGLQRPPESGSRITRATGGSSDSRRPRAGEGINATSATSSAGPVTTTPAPPVSAAAGAAAAAAAAATLSSPTLSHSPAPTTNTATAVPRQGHGDLEAAPANGDGGMPLTSQETPPLGANERERLIVKALTLPRKRRLLRLENGRLVVLPTNVYKQGGGVKLDLALGGFRINGEKCTVKNRAFNFGVLQGFTEENLLALRAFRNILIPPERVGSIHPIAAAEILHRYDEEHAKPPPGQNSKPAAHPDDGGWIPDSGQVHVTFVGSTMEICVKAGDLRTLDRPLQCKLALEALKNDPRTMKEPPPLEYLSTGSREDGLRGIGTEAGATGFALSNLVGGCVSPSLAHAASAEAVGADAFRINCPDSALESGLEVKGDCCAPARRRKKKKAVKANDGVVYELPTYVQNVDTKLGRSTLRLKMPLSGFLVNGESVSVADLVVAYGLEVTRKNLLALRACREAMLSNFAGPELVKRAVAAELFHVWVKRGEGRESASAEPPSEACDPGDPPQHRSHANTPPKSLENPDKGSAGDSVSSRGATSVTDTEDPPNGSGGSGVPAPLDAKSRSALADDVMVRFTGPVSPLGGKRIEVQMMVGELLKARQNRLAEYRQLLVTKLNDPEVQSGELGVLEPSIHPTPALTEQNSSGAAAAAAATVARGKNENNGEMSRAPTPPHEQRSHGRTPAEWPDNGSAFVLSGRGKRPRYERMRVGGGGAAGASPSAEGVVEDRGEAAALSASKRRRQLWMLAIRDNELRYEQRKEDARREYELRQQQLLRWMVDEEAGRHEDSGEAGPPPMVEKGVGPCTP